MYSLLIVEDEYLVRQGIRSLVDFDQFAIDRIAEAENGQVAWELFQENPYDIVLTDINMPKLNGIQLAELIKAKAPKTHLVFLTGYDDFNYALSALKLGADDYLLKPFSKSDVEEMLKKLKQKLEKLKKTEALQKLVDKPQQEGSEIKLAIQERLADSSLTLKSLSSQLGFSPNYLSVLIKKDLGLPFQDYLIQERLKKAKLLLLTTDLRVYEIAEQVGFEDINYFSQRFKQLVGMTPRQYKKGEGQ
ncbi:TPA: response regulator [Streptococcus equi subsp. zooepidemicus]|uniref:response regulator transcription factor n=1 Tax=Streptococcus equi TaxID=1336 RepID=UPI0013F5990B|nr:response regulator [Streptococcus equi]MCD3397040.1 response regulator [Streptococcus equi subsp. zooepidemicus]MCD3427297.1 response regulator [Streptococcus equi subsp. zooepidemicus]MDI5947266.1 response regulator [Streptococcus equi subsp. zooepidemicus]QTC11825.1 putative response regulatory protein [Streptococcus equi subsp. zooepidemicus]HEL0015784.1 response regulator [Streptococcus equi subsp. zooepidemicus]